MAYSEALAERIRHRLVGRMSMDEKKMFGGLGFFLNGNMCVAVWKESLVARVGPEQYDRALQEPFVSEFDITGRAMTGWVLIAPDGLLDDEQLQEWIDWAVKFVETLPSR
jgi:TfoX/Sxy family transcriptional regulator of competence genes